uniref:3'-5' exoribonuclease HELZ2-like n=1 Tax=Centroberyx gerrardi TaxID=166262 RepID=UPI003AB08215
MSTTWTSVSTLTPLLSKHNLKLVCSECSVRENEIAYTLKSVYHQCARNLLICKTKAGSKWRPVSRRPEFPNPSQYVVCWFYKEGFGCAKHKNRCTFARSTEEAEVWNFEKCQRLDHLSICKLIAQSERSSTQLKKVESLDDLLAALDLKAVCSQCSVQEKEITYTVKSVSHQCSRELLLAKDKGSNQWRPVSHRPTFRNCGRNVLYQECMFFSEGSGCGRHGQECTFARSSEEAIVWNFVRDMNIDNNKLIKLLSEPDLRQPENDAENIFQEFSGEFLKLCKDCFLGSPQKITVKRWNDTCSADAAHAWDPVLVHHLWDSQGKEVYSQVRPVPPDCRFEYCSHVRESKPCWHEASQCQSAHSEVEMAVWKAERRGLSVRPELLQLSQQQWTGPRQVTIYCKACFLVLPSPESFFKHCASLEHNQMISEDTTIKWRGRPPPHNRRAEFWLCERPETCEYGNNCVKAHSKEELQEWLMRAKEEKEIRHNIETQGLMSYGERLLEEYKNSSNEVYIMSEQVDDVSVACDEELFVECEQTDAKRQWNFHVNTERPLVHVALLKQEPGASFSLGEISSEPCTYLSGERLQNSNTTCGITVSFTSINLGVYEQWLVLDFDMRPVLLRKIKVRVGQPSSVNIEEPTVNGRTSSESVERWHRGNRAIIPCSTRTEKQEELLKEYKPPQISFLYKPINDRQTALNPGNYKERMHNFLYSEERAEDQVVSRLNVCGEITLSTTLQCQQFDIAPQGELYCAVSVPCNLTPDTPEGLALRQSIQSGLIAPLSSSQNCKVYEATILQHTTTENKIHLQLSKRCCSDLSLKRDETHQMEVQFQLNRHRFCQMHKAVDLLPDTKRVLPDLKNCGVPVNDIPYDKLNAKQQSAIGFITGDSDVSEAVAPLLIYGPFGTGKTFTLATAARELTKQPQNKVLICTYTNSSADLYVRDHFHPFIKKGHQEMRPIRIKANKQGTSLSTTDEITKEYCLLSKDGQRFLPPTKPALDQHKIVITTTAMARHFHDLKLPDGYFTHILIDEASQMLECEALIPLALAGPNTRVVLAGDHMQMGPKLFSVEDHQRSNHTLLNRLFHYYQGQKCDAAQKSRIIFNENYRSTKEIVEFVSTQFYVGKNDVIKAVGNVPAHPNGHSLKFHHVRGECHLDKVSMSWFNKEEVAKVVEIVQDILQHWPSTWGTKDGSSICVLSEGCQVRQIRTALAKKGLAHVKAENIANVQGKQFRAVILTAVQTRDSLKSSHLPGLELFNDARVLNTAMTRAQSQVVVVGDAAALCCFGKCSRIWKSYIDHCINNNSVGPNHLTKDFFESDVKEIARFQRSEHVEESNMHSDAILQQMKDEYDHMMETEYSSDKDKKSVEFEAFDERKASYNITDPEKDNLLALCKRQPLMYKQGKLVMESFDTGYVIPFDSPTQHIGLKGKSNLGKSFAGDEVVLQTTFSQGTLQSKVIGITKKAESARVFVCMLEDEDHCKRKQKSEDQFIKRLMIPITKKAPKIRILLSKKSNNLIPVWEHTEGEWRIVTYQSLDVNIKQNHVFMVQVIDWKDTCLYPLGNVIDILPIGRSLDDGLRILNEEFKVVPAECESNEDFSWADKDRRHRQDLRDVITFTVDPATAKDLDDAISVRDIEDQYELGVHIADVASFVSPGDTLDEDAKTCGSTYYLRGKEPNHMFPQDLSTGHWSLLSGHDRRVVSLMFKVAKGTNQIIGKPTFQLSQINSNRKLSYEKAEDIICRRHGKNPKFDTVEDCVAVAYCFAKAQRKARLVDWAYAQTDDDRLPGKRRAHLMIEELSVLFNTCVSDILINTQNTKNCTPLRCQAAPDPEKVEELEEKYGELIPLSFHVRHRVDNDKQVQNDIQVSNSKSFCILTNVWNDIQSAARDNDIDKIVDLVAADDIHPQLVPLVSQFRRCFGKAYVIRSNSSPKAKIGHYSLSVKSYTQASSPIRRYLDIVLQRLLHNFLCDTPVQYSPRDIEMLCNESEQDIRTAKEFEQKAEMIYYAVSMKKQNASKLAIIVSAEPERDSFRVSFPFNKNIFPDSLPIMYRDLKLEDQPLYPGKNCMTLTWRRRIYSAGTKQIHQEVKRVTDCGPCTEVPLTTWKAIVAAIDKEKWDDAKLLIMRADTKQLPDSGDVLQVETDDQHHYVDVRVQLRPGDTLQVQLTSEIKRGYLTPTVQLVCIKPKFEVCVDHVHSPITCFSRYANHPSKTCYADPHEYVHIWKPLCEMESAAAAVDESDNIVIEDLVVNFHQEQEHTLKGSFNLSLACISAWAIGCNLAKCLLCIRKRGLKSTSTLDSSVEVDPSSFTWVAHGVTYKVDELQNSTNEETKVEFYINHLPMETIPDCVFQKDMRYTVELIPKLVSDIRKENAVVNIMSACDLVKKIALGQHIPREAVQYSVPRGQLMRKEPPKGLPKLNKSQYDAVEKALNNNFTLIQGPPGTGKTVVGVNIVYWFCELNSKCDRKYLDPKDGNKKEVILYCGPSNKSVDVVAEYLLRFGNNLKPLRVYGQQVEMLDYPYPDCTLQFSPRSFRQEHSKPELRSIALHHRMREDENPFSSRIKEFDHRIQLALDKKGKELTAEEVKAYKEVLTDARKYELERHDIILCTCTVSSSLTLTNTVSARQILIDECAMATEPQALIPLVCNKPEKIVLIGDHKQLRPIVKNEYVRKLGMSKSLFERYFIVNKTRAVMLDTQYRMHVDICKFPSEEYYDGLLKTEVERPNSVLLINRKPKPIVFGDIRGEEISLVVSTAKGHENSKANKEERDIVVKIAQKLVKESNVEQQSIVILSPYNAQVSEIKAGLQDIKMSGIPVTTITKSQGSEWRYVIISTVRSLPSAEIEREPDRGWLSKHVGFVGDPNQINVGITRAKEGLCIIGNQELLNCSPAWRNLFRHYNAHGSVTEAKNISVRHVAR